MVRAAISAVFPRRLSFLAFAAAGLSRRGHHAATSSTSRILSMMAATAGGGIRIAIVPGNGGGNVRHANWYGWAERALAR